MSPNLVSAVISPTEMAAIDKAAAASGLDSFGLMAAAGSAVAAAALRHFPDALRFVVLCGPGNNGGDGYIAAARIAESGAGTAVFALGDPLSLRGDAARAHDQCPLKPALLASFIPLPGDVIIDALFGAGLSRSVPDEVATVMRHVTALDLPVLAVDLPSGVDGRTGGVLGESFAACRTVTFVARKPGHLLLPGRTLCGALEVIDIGIPQRIVDAHHGSLRENTPQIWRKQATVLDASAHKYKRGHLAVFSGGPLSTGAARLSASAGLASGAGLVTLATPDAAVPANAAHLTAVMLKMVETASDLKTWLEDKRISAFVLGPAFGDMAKAHEYVALLRNRHLVLDADGITAFRDDPEALFDLFAEGTTRLVMTPHDGEFARLFPDLAKNPALSKVERAIAAARRSHAVIVFKGADTVIADPDGRAVINTNAPPWLATAGSGDVLAGIIGAHLAQGMPAFESAAAGVWRHGEAGKEAGEGLTAETLVQAIRPLHP
ncbi:NAD(P)H-hydrate dehydratase [Rhizobium sp. 32-5/1]|uniref:NAD(P)H-hydrate dehydratase n=1 Tax=Rhizobium sp. 32-5/1 TaxID=3019602 RepID=UPI00240DAFF3|nr:NAD(P)H-hydrate dehydratase [Rhizobium sp. 32-5/1]WEZ83484.1 NAD(P)H-hydrate dehydratase [Rhizobium sp. 32-5/1]